VVGAGPVGSYVAYRLAGMGYGVTVLEQKSSLGEPVCCTGIVSQECVDTFAIDESVVLRRANSARLFSPSGRLLRLWRQEPQACILDRSAFNGAMVSQARDRGVEYVLSSQVKGIQVKDDGVKVEVARQEEVLNFESRVIVIAAGFNSRLDEMLGLGKVGDFVMGAQAEIETIGVDEIEVYCGQELAPAFFAWLVPLSPPRALVGLLSRRSPGLYLRKFMSSLMAEEKIVSADARQYYGGVPLQPLDKTYSDRLVVVGDAAGQVKPITGGGIYYGLLCADMAASNLHRALEANDLSAKSLASYEREWKGKLGQELKICYWARRLYEHLSDRQIDRIFDIIQSRGIDEDLLGMDDLSFDWHSRVLLSLMKHKALAWAIKAMKIPFT